MKRKILLACAVMISIILLLILFPGPIVGLLGIEPVCIQGDLSNLRIVPCPENVKKQPTVTPLSLPTLTGEVPVPVIFDDDGSPDGLVALLYFLSHPSFYVKAVTISCGEAHPDVFAPQLAQFLAGLGRADIPVGVGRPTPLEGHNTFPEPWRQFSDEFWNISLPKNSDSITPQPATELIINTLSNASQPVLFFVSGNHTNLAEALRLEPGIADRIQEVYVMGGSVYIPGNIESDWPEIHNRVAEWNIWVDPLAAREVFNSGLPIHIVPLDATNQIMWTKDDALLWEASGTNTGRMAGDIFDWMLESWSTDNVYIWDLVAAVLATDSSLCSDVPLALNVLVEAGTDQGQTIVVDGPNNVQVCLEPDAGQIKARVARILDQ